MNTHSLRDWAKSYLALCPVISWQILSGLMPLHAHSGHMLAAPTKVSSSITLNGTIDSTTTEAVWAPGVPEGAVPNNCNEFNGTPPAPPVTFYALNDGTNLFLAFDIPDTSANANDVLFLFFDPHHAGGGSPAAADRAFNLGFDNIAANNAVPMAAHHSGTGAGWSAATAGLPAGVEAKYTRHTTGAGKWQIEMKFPFTGPTVGFAFVYLNETGAAAADCNGDGNDDDFYARFPSSLTVVNPMALPAGIANPSAWGDLNYGLPPPMPPQMTLSSSTVTQGGTITATVTSSLDLSAVTAESSHLVVHGAGISIGAVSHPNRTTLSIVLKVAENAAVGQGSLTLIVGGTSSLASFTVQATAEPPIIVKVIGPGNRINVVRKGRLMSVTGENFIGQVKVTFAGGAVKGPNFNGPGESLSFGKIVLIVHELASTGKIKISATGGTTESADSITVLPPPPTCNIGQVCCRPDDDGGCTNCAIDLEHCPPPGGGGGGGGGGPPSEPIM